MAAPNNAASFSTAIRSTAAAPHRCIQAEDSPKIQLKEQHYYKIINEKKMRHKKWITNYEDDFEKLADEIGDLRYDSLANFLVLLSKKIGNDAVNDKKRSRIKLSNALELCSNNLEKGSVNIQNAWNICKPFMTDRD